MRFSSGAAATFGCARNFAAPAGAGRSDGCRLLGRTDGSADASGDAPTDALPRTDALPTGRADASRNRPERGRQVAVAS